MFIESFLRSVGGNKPNSNKMSNLSPTRCTLDQKTTTKYKFWNNLDPFCPPVF